MALTINEVGVMFRYPKGSRVKHQSGAIKDEIVNAFAPGNAPTGYQIKWDNGNHRYPAEQDLCGPNIDSPKMHDSQQSPK